MIINIKYKSLEPISHIGKTTSNGAFFQTILTADGEIPAITANSIRGQLRDCGAKYLMDTLDYYNLDKYMFDLLFSGGNVAGNMKNDIGKIKEIHKYFPIIKLFGGAVWDNILDGNMIVTNAYPVCTETDPACSTSWRELIGDIEYTRTDDKKKYKLREYMGNSESQNDEDVKASQQMRYSVQYMAQGTEWLQKIIITDESLLGILLSCFVEWSKTCTIGGMSNKGFGLFEAVMSIGGHDDIKMTAGNFIMPDDLKGLLNAYCDNICDNKKDIIDNLQLLTYTKEKVKKNVKKTDAAVESDNLDFWGAAE